MKLLNDTDYKNFRKAIGHGILDAVIGAVALYAAALLLLLIFNFMFLDYDDTDDEANGVRSGLIIRIDHGTGCQYLQTKAGNLTPRLNRNGRHLCDKTSLIR